MTRVGAGPHENRLVQRSEDGNVRRARRAHWADFGWGLGVEDGRKACEASLHLGDVDKVSVIESRVGTGRSGVVDLDHHRRPFGNRRLGKGKSGQRRRNGLLLGWERSSLHDGSVGIELGQDPAVRWLARDDVDRTETLDWINVEYRGWAPRGRRRKRLFFGRRGGRLVNNDGSPGGGRRLVDHDIVGGGAIIAATTRADENSNNEKAGRQHDPV